MARTIYDKPTRALLKDLQTEWGLKPGQVFTTPRRRASSSDSPRTTPS